MELTKFFAPLLQYVFCCFFYYERLLFEQRLGKGNQMLHHFTLISHHVSRTALHAEFPLLQHFLIYIKCYSRYGVNSLECRFQFIFSLIDISFLSTHVDVCRVHKRLIFIINKPISSAEYSPFNCVIMRIVHIYHTRFDSGFVFLFCRIF